MVPRVPLLPILALLAAACASSEKTAHPSSLENDGARVRVIQADRDTTYHAALEVLVGEGYTIQTANPLGGQVVALSPVRKSFVPFFGDVLKYTIARIDLESPPSGGTRVRLFLTATKEPEGAGRRPNNDRPVTGDEPYDDLFAKIATAAGA